MIRAFTLPAAHSPQPAGDPAAPPALQCPRQLGPHHTAEGAAGPQRWQLGPGRTGPCRAAGGSGARGRAGGGGGRCAAQAPPAGSPPAPLLHPSLPLFPSFPPSLRGSIPPSCRRCALLPPELGRAAHRPRTRGMRPPQGTAGRRRVSAGPRPLPAARTWEGAARGAR